jgi:hypothetical protein
MTDYRCALREPYVGVLVLQDTRICFSNGDSWRLSPSFFRSLQKPEHDDLGGKSAFALGSGKELMPKLPQPELRKGLRL